MQLRNSPPSQDFADPLGFPRTPFRPLPPPEGALRYPGTPDQARRVRAALGPLLAGFPAADEVILLVHELVANAIIHSASGAAGGSFTVRITRVPGGPVTAPGSPA